MRILFVASECYPLVKTGGLADVVGALPLALARDAVDVKVMIPGYRGVLDKLIDVEEAAYYPDVFGAPGWLRSGRTTEGLGVLVLDAPHLYDRPGTPYLGPDGRDWPDNPVRYAALSAIGAAVARFGIGPWRPDLVHAHDWQTGLVPAYLKAAAEPAPPTVFTIHNIAFQGICSPSAFAALGLPGWIYSPAGLEFYGQASFLKAGLVYSDWLTTVSPTYARELRTPEFGLGMEGILNERHEVFTGIINGIDTTLWDPETDPLLPASYSAKRLQGKARCKAALQEHFGLEQRPDALLFSIVSRLTGQKGLDLVLLHIDTILRNGGQLVVLGTGEPGIERAFHEAAAANPGRVAANVGYDENLSHVIQAGADAILIPSRFEPCGLTQLYGLRYGTLPIVTRTGGLADTVIDANEAALRAGVATGIVFTPITQGAFGFAIERAFTLHADEKSWKKMQARAMSHPVGWEDSAQEYQALYRHVIDQRLR